MRWTLDDAGGGRMSWAVGHPTASEIFPPIPLENGKTEESSYMPHRHGKAMEPTNKPLSHDPHPNETPEEHLALIERLYPGAIEAMANAE